MPSPSIFLPLAFPICSREGFQAEVGRTELRAWCKGRIARFKIPRHWKLVDSFPLTVSGKPMKYKMREAAVVELGLAQMAEAEAAATPVAAPAQEEQQ
jgi:acyl-CoA synthetase (AMP-forming)/AMP-acid ligase II